MPPHIFSGYLKAQLIACDGPCDVAQKFLTRDIVPSHSSLYNHQYFIISLCKTK